MSESHFRIAILLVLIKRTKSDKAETNIVDNLNMLGIQIEEYHGEKSYYHHNGLYRNGRERERKHTLCLESRLPRRRMRSISFFQVW